MNLVLFILSTIGMAHIIIDGAIMEWFRNFVKYISLKIDQFLMNRFKNKKFTGLNLGSVVDCYLCCGTWCGFLMGIAWISVNPLQIFACGCAGGFLANLGAVLLNWIEAATIVNLPQDQNND